MLFIIIKSNKGSFSHLTLNYREVVSFLKHEFLRQFQKSTPIDKKMGL